ncbi:transposable element Tcb2 transposase [Trichonephila clavipes]|nr:transposable element Tcb2 transposase [Trichonephila clavipes]
MEFSNKATVPLASPGWLLASRLLGYWLQHSSDFSAMNWPPRSTGLNPIEHLGDVLEQGMKGHHTAPTNLTELWTALANI